MSNQWGQQPGNQPQWGQPQQQPSSQPSWGQPQQQPPNQQQWGQPQQPPVQQTWNQPQQPPVQQQPVYPGQFRPQQPVQKKNKNLTWVISGVIILAIILCGEMGYVASKNSKAVNTADSNTSTQGIPATVAPTATPAPTPTPVPTETAAQKENDYKAGTTDMTITTLDKDGSADTGKDVHFTATIFNFVKDSAGLTAGANVTAPDASGDIQIAFTSGTDISQLNQGDVLEVWGNDKGTFSGQNAFGGTVQEVGVSAKYMLDQTTGYQVNA